MHAIGIGWDTVYAPSVPVTHAVMCFVANLRGTIAESGEKTIALRLIDADGVDVMPALQQKVRFEVKPPRLEGGINLVMQIGGVQFKKYGTYAFHLVVQENEMGSVPFSVVEPPRTA